MQAWLNTHNKGMDPFPQRVLQATLELLKETPMRKNPHYCNLLQEQLLSTLPLLLEKKEEQKKSQDQSGGKRKVHDGKHSDELFAIRCLCRVIRRNNGKRNRVFCHIPCIEKITLNN
ncbi:hypothetical protein CEXT_432151 [Caerostris extrusa]|uniref:Uncharacterized protein n=1 Tax=Caerostris extrusa TaxID=172846 RepID=A0AAV4U7V8_CAEEX|nr:hypothetical protein CEXT_432151 [Caerostris extrusa]